MDAQNRVHDANDLALGLLGDRNAKGRALSDFVTDPARLAKLLQSVRAGEASPVRLSVARTDGTVTEMEWKGHADASGVLLLAWDAGPHDKGSQRVTARERVHHAIFERSRDALFVFEVASSLIVDVSEAACELLGQPRGALIGQHRMGLFPAESAIVYEQAFADHVARVNAVPVPVVFQRPDGTRMHGEMSATVVDEAGVFVLQVVYRGIPERLRETEERIRLLERRRERQKLEAVAVLAGGIAHEVNNLLAGILTTATLLSRA
ncbi:MAG: PAS domain-containing protein, partial [Myxococcales bacterium]